MAMSRKKKRIYLIGIGAALLVSASVMVGVGMRDSIVYFFSPSEIAQKHPGPAQRLRVGGLVVKGSLVKDSDGSVMFTVTDGEMSQKVHFAGVLPDLFREGQGIIAEGHLRSGLFVADQVLAKHDEKYMPKEIAETLKQRGEFRPASPDGAGG